MTIIDHKNYCCSLLPQKSILQSAYDIEYTKIQNLEKKLGISLFDLPVNDLKDLAKSCVGMPIKKIRNLIRSYLVSGKKTHVSKKRGSLKAITTDFPADFAAKCSKAFPDNGHVQEAIQTNNYGFLKYALKGELKFISPEMVIACFKDGEEQRLLASAKRIVLARSFLRELLCLIANNYLDSL